ncbi:hypothetical protein [Neobacillus vireti]|uniref:hypothetical protein n=1 Tax=Neobacillus vireti TaxID=220686 RepID=UPI002FFDE355
MFSCESFFHYLSNQGSIRYFIVFDEWKDLEDVDWVLHNNKIDRLMNDYFKKWMNRYQQSKALWE